jgi:hypothetical protein
MNYIDVPPTDAQLTWMSEYFVYSPPAREIIQAVRDRREGFGMIWGMTDFDTLFGKLSHYPANWVIGQVRDKLRDIVEYYS